MPMKIYTIGYTGFTVEEFVDALKAHGVNALIDVRSKPYSEHNPEYDSPAIEGVLREFGIHYRSYAHEFGARQEDRRFYGPEGYMDFEIFARSEQFREGVRRLCDAGGYTFALMCAEKDAIKCHRAILVGRAFHELGHEVIHIMPDGDITHSELEQRLLDTFCPERMQGDIFEGFMSNEESLREAYRRCNAAIGWRPE